MAVTVWGAAGPTSPPVTTRPVAITTPTCSGTPAAVLSFGTGFDQRESGADSALGVMLIRLRITEIGQHAVSRVIGDVAMMSFDDVHVQHR